MLAKFWHHLESSEVAAFWSKIEALKVEVIQEVKGSEAYQKI